MRTVILVVVIVVLVILGIYAYRYAMDSPYRVSAEVARKLIQMNQIDLVLDVRTDFERSSLGYYPNSVHIPTSDLAAKMPRQYPDKSMRILAYCNSGQRARAATEKLQAMGYRNARYIATTYGSLLN